MNPMNASFSGPVSGEAQLGVDHHSNRVVTKRRGVGARSVFSTALLALTIASVGCVAPSATPPHRGAGDAREPINLTTAKQAVLAYAESGAYDRDLQSVASEARAWIIQRVQTQRPGERLAVVFDVDETVISNLAHMKEMDFGYVVPEWNDWVNSGAGTALVPVREVYDECLRRGVAVIFITGRKDPRDRPGTEKNLRAQGMGEYARLILAQPEEAALGTSERKARARAALEKNEGYRVIASIGDQQTDLDGGFAERVFKLPNPFYHIP